MIYKNFAYSRIVTAPVPAGSGTVVEITAGDGTLFPATPFNAVIWPVGEMPLSTNAEIVTVTDTTGDVFIITRQQEGTPARNIIVGDRISATITAYTSRTFRFLNPVVVTGPYTVLEDDDLIVCSSATPFTLTLLPATGSGRVLNVKNINTGLVTVDGSGGDTIDGETTQVITRYDNIQICDYALGLWIII